MILSGWFEPRTPRMPTTRSTAAETNPEMRSEVLTAPALAALPTRERLESAPRLPTMKKSTTATTACMADMAMTAQEMRCSVRWWCVRQKTGPTTPSSCSRCTWSASVEHMSTYVIVIMSTTGWKRRNVPAPHPQTMATRVTKLTR